MIATVNPLTIRQQAVLDFILTYQQTNQRPPTIRTIQKQFGIKSPNGVLCHLKALKSKGKIKTEPFTAAGIRVLGMIDPYQRIAELEAKVRELEDQLATERGGA